MIVTEVGYCTVYISAQFYVRTSDIYMQKENPVSPVKMYHHVSDLHC